MTRVDAIKITYYVNRVKITVKGGKLLRAENLKCKFQKLKEKEEGALLKSLIKLSNQRKC